MDRRSWLKTITATGVGTLVFQRALAAQATGQEDVTAEMIQQAQWISGAELNDEEISELQEGLGRKIESWKQLRAIEIAPQESPTVHFRPKTRFTERSALARGPVQNDDIVVPDQTRPSSDDDLAFLSVLQLAGLLRSRQITSLELTRLYLERLKRFDPLLKCVVNLTEDLALQQAKQADSEISEGRFRSVIHGIPWGAKDLMSVPGYPTTWGVPQFRDQTFTEAATVYQRLTDAGAVLVAKLSLGALAMGDRWFGGMTRNPWNAETGSSGSSAGSASATAAGLVGFAIGTETLGSILSPSRVCGTVGLRPTFGAVSRHGCMPLSWTMDKVGPITRFVSDAKIVLDVIQGPDGHDPTVVERDYSVAPRTALNRLRVGYTTGRRRGSEERPDLEILKSLGCTLVEVELPDELPAYALTSVLEIEGASVFESWLNKREVEGWNSWPRIFRSAQFVSALDYLRAQRLRGRLINQMEELFDQVDVLINTNDLVITNLTGHPSLSVPFQISEREGKPFPRPCVLTGRYFDEGTLCSLGLEIHNQVKTYQQHPPIEEQLQALNAPQEAEKPEKEPTGSGQSGQNANDNGDKNGND